MLNETILKDELIIKIDSSSISSIDKFISLLNSNNIDVKAIGRDEYLIRL
ncbi:hypothetical protein [Clostridium tertium]|uniref:Uncharacterized protein n=1 Tax=Clostridium tertium TaxID=1559 RepID=A0A6N3EWV5_9CLOT